MPNGDDRPLTGKGTQQSYTLTLPRAIQFVDGGFSVTSADDDPFVTLTISGPPNTGALKLLDDGSIQWTIDRAWMIKIE